MSQTLLVSCAEEFDATLQGLKLHVIAYPVRGYMSGTEAVFYATEIHSVSIVLDSIQIMVDLKDLKIAHPKAFEEIQNQLPESEYWEEQFREE